MDMALSGIEDRFSKLSEVWDFSPEKKDLTRIIREKVLTEENVFVDSALCIGLGSLELYPETYAASYYDEQEDLMDDEGLMSFCIYESTRRIRQLIVFETVLECLRKYTLQRSS